MRNRYSEHWRKWRAKDEADNMTEAELLEFFTCLPKTELWLHTHLKFVWRMFYWNWFNLWTGEEGFWLFARHFFREWK